MAKSMARHWWVVTLGFAAIATITFLVVPMTAARAQATSRGVLYLAAVTDDRLADHGDRGEAALFIAVNSEAGAQEGLLKGNFLVETQLGSVIVAVGQLSSTGHGVYRLDIVPGGTTTWVRGRYVLSVYVSCPAGSGSTVTELLID